MCCCGFFGFLGFSVFLFFSVGFAASYVSFKCAMSRLKCVAPQCLMRCVFILVGLPSSSTCCSLDYSLLSSVESGDNVLQYGSVTFFFGLRYHFCHHFQGSPIGKAHNNQSRLSQREEVPLVGCYPLFKASRIQVEHLA